MSSTRIRTGWATLMQALIDSPSAGVRARILLDGIAREPWVLACGLWRLEESPGTWTCLLSRGAAEGLHGRGFLEEVAAGRAPADLVPGQGVLLAGHSAGALALTFAGRPESEAEIDLLGGLLHVVRLMDTADAGSEHARAESFVPVLPRAADTRTSPVTRTGSTCEPAQLLLQLVEAESAACARARVRMDLELEDGARGCLVDIPADEFVCATRNLVHNAREAQEQAADGGRIRILLRATASAELALTIEDAGPGLPEEAVAALEAGDPQHLPGPGLGLAISWGIALGANGALRLLHSCEQGSCLEIRLPIASRT
jgi:hypothetical protein